MEDGILDEIARAKRIGKNEGINRKIEVYELGDGRKVVVKRRKPGQYNLMECGLAVLKVLGIAITSSDKHLYLVSLPQARLNEERRKAMPVNSPAIHYIDDNVLVEDFIAGKPLDRYLCECGIDEVGDIGMDMGRELAIVHKCGYVFGDLKASNVIVTPERELYHIDFERCGELPGNSGDKFLKDVDLATLVGSLYPLRPRTLKKFRRSLYGGYEAMGGKVDNKTVTLGNCCGLFIHRRIVPEVIRNVSETIAGPYASDFQA